MVKLDVGISKHYRTFLLVFETEIQVESALQNQ